MPVSAATDTSRGMVVRWDWLLAGAGVVGTAICLWAVPHDVRAAATQTWSPFVLVAGLVLVGLVAEEDGLFRAAGLQLARLSDNGVALFIGAAVLITVVTATLNLDTSVVFLTPVLIATARHSGMGQRPLLYGSILLANASSLFLPGSNLTNLIVLGRQPHSGSAFLAAMWPAALAASVVTAGCVGLWSRRDLTSTVVRGDGAGRPTIGIGLAAVVAATVLVLVLPSPALPVLIVGFCAGALRVVQGKIEVRRLGGALGGPVLVGLFGLTLIAGTLGRAWTGLAHQLSHTGGPGTAVIAALGSVAINNLPAASVLAAHHPHHGPQLLVGLNLGPNLFVTGSLAWFLWFRTARASGVRPSIASVARLGVLVVPLSMAAALGTLALTGSG